MGLPTQPQDKAAPAAAAHVFGRRACKGYEGEVAGSAGEATGSAEDTYDVEH